MMNQETLAAVSVALTTAMIGQGLAKEDGNLTPRSAVKLFSQVMAEMTVMHGAETGAENVRRSRIAISDGDGAKGR